MSPKGKRKVPKTLELEIKELRNDVNKLYEAVEALESYPIPCWPCSWFHCGVMCGKGPGDTSRPICGKAEPRPICGPPAHAKRPKKK